VRQSESLIPSGTIVEGEIVPGDINCLVVEIKWVKLKSNRDAWGVTLLSRKSYVLTIAFILVVSTQSNK